MWRLAAARVWCAIVVEEYRRLRARGDGYLYTRLEAFARGVAEAEWTRRSSK